MPFKFLLMLQPGREGRSRYNTNLTSVSPSCFKFPNSYPVPSSLHLLIMVYKLHVLWLWPPLLLPLLPPSAHILKDHSNGCGGRGQRAAGRPRKRGWQLGAGEKGLWLDQGGGNRVITMGMSFPLPEILLPLPCHSPLTFPAIISCPAVSFPGKIFPTAPTMCKLFATFLDSVRPVLLFSFYRRGNQDSGRHKTCPRYMAHLI